MTERDLLTGDEYTRPEEKKFNIKNVKRQNKINKEKSNHHKMEKF